MSKDSGTSEVFSRIPRGLVLFNIVMLLAAVGLIVKHDMGEADYVAAAEAFQEMDAKTRNMKVPNAKHVWWAYDLFLHTVDGRTMASNFYSDYTSVNGDWSSLCRLDSNGDGISNGQHLGDPCCRWRPSDEYFSLPAGREYRRWRLGHPGEDRIIAMNNMQATLSLNDSPLNCSSYDPSTYKEQFDTFYFYKADAEPQKLKYGIVKFIGLVMMLMIFAHWALFKGMLKDVLPWTTPQSLSWRVRIAVAVASFVYCDLTSGVIHLVLDYAPHNLPGIGVLAQGFQFHHHDPTAIIRISWFEYVSHIHFLCPLIQVAVVLSNASRVQRLFWLCSGVWAHLFQTAHRWAHMPPASLPWMVRAMQSSGAILSHERHMSHHEDLDHQFTILSGHTDFILDNLSSVVPPARYDLWLLFGVFWFLIPMVADTICIGSVHEGLRGGKAGGLVKVEKGEV